MTSWDRVPDGIGPIVGFRMWSYTLSQVDAHLHPPMMRGDWSTPSPWEGAEARWVMAECAMVDTDPTHAPAEDCRCGFYAMKSLELVPVFDVQMPNEDGVRVGTILGRVELAGKIIEHDRGYRAERARIVELIPIEGHEADAERLSWLLCLPLGLPAPATTPPSPHLPPRGPSALRLRVRHWVQDVAA